MEVEALVQLPVTVLELSLPCRAEAVAGSSAVPNRAMKNPVTYDL